MPVRAVRRCRCGRPGSYVRVLPVRIDGGLPGAVVHRIREDQDSAVAIGERVLPTAPMPSKAAPSLKS